MSETPTAEFLAWFDRTHPGRPLLDTKEAMQLMQTVRNGQTAQAVLNEDVERRAAMQNAWAGYCLGAYHAEAQHD